MKTRVWILAAAIALAVGLSPRATAAEQPAAGAAKPQGPYVVVVGVGEFKDAAIKPRPTADADAKALHALLTDPKVLGVPADRAKLRRHFDCNISEGDVSMVDPQVKIE